MKYDVAIIGGGPGGSTLSSLLKKYKPELSVLVLEREKFPREHVGESQLPPIGAVLEEMGCWDKIEAANFPIKIGATYKWGNTNDLWDFELYPADKFVDEPRPAKYEGQRKHTAFQVERAVYDDILLRHAESLNVEVREEVKVTKIRKSGDRIEGLDLDSGETVEATWYVDCSGTSAIIRNQMNVEIEEPGQLRNIAVWDYWTDTDWAVSIGTGGTRVQVMSLGYGWIWFIPISPTKTSIGLVCPVQYLQNSGMKPEEIYAKAILEEPLISSLIKGATRLNETKTTKDWSYVAKRMSGENWFLCGEAMGFADPILAAGLTMTHIAARELACAIVALEEGTHDKDWLKREYENHQRRRVSQHIQFANFWYTANGCFTDLKEMTRDIAKDAGLELDANAAFQWLGTGGFVDEFGNGLSGFDLNSVRDVVNVLTDERPEFEVAKFNRFKLNLQGAELVNTAVFHQGKVYSKERYEREGKTLPRVGIFHVLCQIIERSGDMAFIVPNMVRAIMQKGEATTAENAMVVGIPYLESMLRDGWITGEWVEGEAGLTYDIPKYRAGIKFNTDTFVKA